MSAAEVASPGLDGPGGAGDLRLGSPLPGQAKQGSEHTGTGLRGQGSASPPWPGGPVEAAGSLLTSSWGPQSSSYSRAANGRPVDIPRPRSELTTGVEALGVSRGKWRDQKSSQQTHIRTG